MGDLYGGIDLKCKEEEPGLTVNVTVTGLYIPDGDGAMITYRIDEKAAVGPFAAKLAMTFPGGSTAVAFMPENRVHKFAVSVLETESRLRIRVDHVDAQVPINGMKESIKRLSCL